MSAVAEDARIVCPCMGVTEAAVRAYLAEPGASFDGLVDATGVGTRCTACRLDLDVLIGGLHMRAYATRTPVAQERKISERGWRQAADQANSGFFVCDDEITTVLRVSNHSQLFAGDTAIVPYRYDLRLFTEAGRRAAHRRGRIEPETALELPFAELEGCPRRGWFLLSLVPLAEGMVGAVRPQVALKAGRWTATYHPQLHAMACRAKTVLTIAQVGRFDGMVSLINAAGRETAVRFTLYGPDGAAAAQADVALGARASAFVELDSLFPQPPADTVLALSVTSDRPVRKHVINRHRDGSWSLDHFPNAK